MVHIDELVEQIKELDRLDFNTLRKKYFNVIKSRQEHKFNIKFPNLELDEYSSIKSVQNTIHYYKFHSQAHIYEVEITVSNAKAKKYSLGFHFDFEKTNIPNKIPEKKFIINDKIDVKDYLGSIHDDYNIDITMDELFNVINYLFFNKKFIHNILC